mmetsp:Transcript_10382/g.14524  ORF Transcript_10382/g.14524 Transcript_10382/m.14524 type:complete len:417 (+) Transcript_10382:926-2176(+)
MMQQESNKQPGQTKGISRKGREQFNPRDLANFANGNVGADLVHVVLPVRFGEELCVERVEEDLRERPGAAKGVHDLDEVVNFEEEEEQQRGGGHEYEGQRVHGRELERLRVGGLGGGGLLVGALLGGAGGWGGGEGLAGVRAPHWRPVVGCAELGRDEGDQDPERPNEKGGEVVSGPLAGVYPQAHERGRVLDVSEERLGLLHGDVERGNGDLVLGVGVQGGVGVEPDVQVPGAAGVAVGAGQEAALGGAGGGEGGAVLDAEVGLRAAGEERVVAAVVGQGQRVQVRWGEGGLAVAAVVVELVFGVQHLPAGLVHRVPAAQGAVDHDARSAQPLRVQRLQLERAASARHHHHALRPARLARVASAQQPVIRRRQHRALAPAAQPRAHRRHRPKRRLGAQQTVLRTHRAVAHRARPN